jgi:hypothetical protein
MDSVGKKLWNVLDEIVPVYDILWDVFHGVLEEEPVLVPKYRSRFSLFKANFVDIVAKSQVICVRWKSVELLP